MNNEIDTKEQERFLEQELTYLPRQRWGILKIILIGCISPFVLPFMPMKNVNMASKENYADAILIFAVFSAILTPIGCYLHIKKINYEIYSAKFDLELLRKKRENQT